MILTDKEVMCVCLACIAIAFVLGWIFPVEGPIDFVYDNAVKKKAPIKPAPQQKKVLIDLNDDGLLEEYYLIFMNKEGEQ